MVCPRCKKEHDIIAYTPLETIREFAAETTPCYKCPSCKWIFAPADKMPHEIFQELRDLVTSLREQLAEREAEGKS